MSQPGGDARKSAQPSDDDKLMDHEYDGIREYDNPMPRWWLLLFAVTILFVPIYYLAPGDIGAGAKKAAMYEKEMAAFAAAHPEFGKSAVTAEDMARIAADPAEVSKGRALFAANCVSCHLPDGGGAAHRSAAELHHQCFAHR
jgi:cytochrome c oxidase cbb3-type subunit 3